MQKKIIALAVAGLASTAAFAQTNVTIYGVADMGFAYTNVNGGNAANTANGGSATAGSQNGRDQFGFNSGLLGASRIGFKGTEDLGNGLKAIFTLEYALNLDQNTGIGAGTIGSANAGASATANGLQARQQFVGLSTKAGEITLGRLYAPGYATLAMDPLAASAGLSVVDAAQAAGQAALRAGSASRWNNAVSYKTPNMAGFSAHAVYAAGEYQNEVAMGESYGIGADYAAGPFAVKYVWQNTAVTNGVMNVQNGAANNGTNSNLLAVTQGATATPVGGAQQEHYVGASFDLKVVKLMGSAQIIDKGNRANSGLGAEGAVYQFGAVVPVGKGNIHASYAYADMNSQNRLGNGYHGEYSGVSVAYTHGLSKRTTLYTGLRYQDLDQKATAASTNVGAGGVTTVFAAGINHSF